MSEELVKSGVVDILAVKNQELAKTESLVESPVLDKLSLAQQEESFKRQEVRNWLIVQKFLKKKFPDVGYPMNMVTEKEFPRMLKLAKNHYQKRLWGNAILSVASFTGIVELFLNVPPPSPPAALGIVVLLIATFVSGVSAFSFGYILKTGKNLMEI